MLIFYKMSDKKEILVPDGKEDNNKNADHEGFVNYLYFVYFRQYIDFFPKSAKV